MSREALIAEVSHSTFMLRDAFYRQDRDDALFWWLNRTRARAILNNPLNWT